MAPQIGSVAANANHDMEIYGITTTFMLLAIVAVALRFVTVIYLRHQKPGLDDYVIGVSLVGFNFDEKVTSLTILSCR